MEATVVVLTWKARTFIVSFMETSNAFRAVSCIRYMMLPTSQK